MSQAVIDALCLADVSAAATAAQDLVQAWLILQLQPDGAAYGLSQKTKEMAQAVSTPHAAVCSVAHSDQQVLPVRRS